MRGFGKPRTRGRTLTATFTAAMLPSLIEPGQGIPFYNDEAWDPVFEAAQDISLSDYSSWGEAERIVVNVASLYSEFSGGTVATPPIGEMFSLMAKLRNARRH